MTITYEYFSSLYVNITNRCSNTCTFCVRNKHDDVNGKDNLWLEHEPTIDEIKDDFLSRDLSKYDSIVFCGYGEPTMRFDDMCLIAKWLKTLVPELPIRLNTNGQANLICKRDVTPELDGLFSCVSISLNAETAEKYQKLCVSEFGGDTAFEAIQDFAVKAKKYVPDVVFSVVDIMSAEEIDKCRLIAEKCGANFRIREFID